MAKSRGRPQWKPTSADRRFVGAMAAGGIDQNRIAAALGIAPKTLRRHCREALDSGAERATARVVAAMLHMATKAPYAVRYQAARFCCSAGPVGAIIPPARFMVRSCTKLHRRNDMAIVDFIGRTIGWLVVTGTICGGVLAIVHTSHPGDDPIPKPAAPAAAAAAAAAPGSSLTDAMKSCLSRSFLVELSSPQLHNNDFDGMNDRITGRCDVRWSEKPAAIDYIGSLAHPKPEGQPAAWAQDPAASQLMSDALNGRAHTPASRRCQTAVTALKEFELSLHFTETHRPTDAQSETFGKQWDAILDKCGADILAELKH
jgi:hypothetical protein